MKKQFQTILLCHNESFIFYTRYAEIKDYDFHRNSRKNGAIRTVKYFTQLLWKKSTKLGVGIATLNNTVIVVAKYKTAGNVAGQYGDNVLLKSGMNFKFSTCINHQVKKSETVFSNIGRLICIKSIKIGRQTGKQVVRY